MQVYLNQLSQHVKPLKPLYVLSGDEPLQILEAANEIRQACQNQGILNRSVFNVDHHFNWDDLLLEANSMSLFAENKLIELRFTSSTINKNASDALLEYLQHKSDNDVLLVTLPAITAKVMNSPWYKAFDNEGITLRIWPVDKEKLPQWLQQRGIQQDIKLDRDAAVLLADRIEGNLLAAKQEIDKLQILFYGKSVTVDDIETSVANNSRFNVFTLIDSMLAQKAIDSLRALKGLEGEGTHPIQINSLLTQKIHQLLTLKQHTEDGLSIDSAISKVYLQAKQKNLIKYLLPRLRITQLEALLAHCATVDHIIKGMKQGNPWIELQAIILSLAGTSLSTNRYRL